jgi:hypothetical protein
MALFDGGEYIISRFRLSKSKPDHCLSTGSGDSGDETLLFPQSTGVRDLDFRVLRLLSGKLSRLVVVIASSRIENPIDRFFRPQLNCLGFIYRLDCSAVQRVERSDKMQFQLGHVREQLYVVE